MSLKTYPRGLNEPDHVKHADASRIPGRILPGDAVVHVSYSGHGIVVSVSDVQVGVLWSIEPKDPFATFAMPLVRRQHQQLIAKQIVSIQPMSLPSGLIFYHDYTYGSGSKTGEKDDAGEVK